MEGKDATIKISLKADSGYSCDIKGRIGLDQWEQINTIIDSGACVPNLQSDLEKATELLHESKLQIEYLQSHFAPKGGTGSGNAVLSKLTTFLEGRKQD